MSLSAPPSAASQPAAERAAEGMPARQRRKAARPQELLDAALALFVEKGFAATRTEEVAERAGVSKGTLYLYYPSKEDLLKAVIAQNISREIAESMDRVLRFEGSSAELLRLMLREWWANAGEASCGGICRLMMSEAGNFPELASYYEAEVIQPARSLWRAVLERGMARGEFRPMPVESTIAALMAPMLFLVMQRHTATSCPQLGSPVDPAEVVERVAELMLDGLCRPAAAPSDADRRPA